MSNKIDNFIHESSYVDRNVHIGKNTKIWHFCHILENTNIGDKCSIGQNVVIGPNVCVGNRVKIPLHLIIRRVYKWYNSN